MNESGLSCAMQESLFHTILIKAIALPKAEVTRQRAASADFIVAAQGRSFRLTRSDFCLSPVARRRPLETFVSVPLLLCF